MIEPFVITADEVNCLIHAYFLDSGFQHSAFALRTEGRLEHSPHFRKHVTRGELIELLSKALLYSEVEAHWRGNAMTANCKSTFSLLERHACSLDPALPQNITYEPPPVHEIDGILPYANGTAEKRKATTPPASEELPREKRVRTEDDMEVDSSVASTAERRNVDGVSSTRNSSIGPVSAPEPAPKKKQPAKQSGPVDDNAISLLKGHNTEVFVCAWNPADVSKLATGSKDAIAHIWKLRDTPSSGGMLESDPPLTLAHLPKADQGDFTSLDWNTEGTLLAIGSYDALLRICTASSELYFSCAQHKGPIFATRFSKSGKWLLTASLDGSVCVWDIPGKKLHSQYNCHEECCLDVDWISEEIFASCGADGKIQVMKLGSSTPMRSYSGHSSEVNMIKCNPGHTLLASCSDDRTARIWDIGDILHPRPPNNNVVVLSGHTHTVSSIAWCPRTPDGEHEILATSSFDGTSRLWDSTTGECLRVFSDHKRPVYALAFSPDARQFATGSGDGWLNVYDVKSRKKQWSWRVDSDRPGIFEIDWQQSGNVNRMALALECSRVGIVEVSRIPALQ